MGRTHKNIRFIGSMAASPGQEFVASEQWRAVTVTEAAEAWGVSDTAVWAAIKRGELRGVTYRGRSPRIPISEVERVKPLIDEYRRSYMERVTKDRAARERRKAAKTAPAGLPFHLDACGDASIHVKLEALTAMVQALLDEWRGCGGRTAES